MALNDFDVLLDSVVPHRAFSNYLKKEYPEMVPYLQMVHLCKLYQDDKEMFEILKKD